MTWRTLWGLLKTCLDVRANAALSVDSTPFAFVACVRFIKLGAVLENCSWVFLLLAVARPVRDSIFSGLSAFLSNPGGSARSLFLNSSWERSRAGGGASASSAYILAVGAAPLVGSPVQLSATLLVAAQGSVRCACLAASRWRSAGAARPGPGNKGSAPGRTLN